MLVPTQEEIDLLNNWTNPKPMIDHPVEVTSGTTDVPHMNVKSTNDSIPLSVYEVEMSKLRKELNSTTLKVSSLEKQLEMRIDEVIRLRSETDYHLLHGFPPIGYAPLSQVHHLESTLHIQSVASIAQMDKIKQQQQVLIDLVSRLHISLTEKEYKETLLEKKNDELTNNLKEMEEHHSNICSQLNDNISNLNIKFENESKITRVQKKEIQSLRKQLQISKEETVELAALRKVNQELLSVALSSGDIIRVPVVPQAPSTVDFEDIHETLYKGKPLKTDQEKNTNNYQELLENFQDLLSGET